MLSTVLCLYFCHYICYTVHMTAAFDVHTKQRHFRHVDYHIEIMQVTLKDNTTTFLQRFYHVSS